MELAHELQAYPEATWYDRFVLSRFLRGLQDPQFSTYLTELEKNAPSKASSLAALLSWMAKNSLGLLRSIIPRACRRIASELASAARSPILTSGCASGRIWKRSRQGKLGAI